MVLFIRKGSKGLDEIVDFADAVCGKKVRSGVNAEYEMLLRKMVDLECKDQS